MAETKGISVQVPVDLHAKVKAEQEQLELTMNQYIQQVLEEHFTPKLNEKGGNDMNGNTRTLAFQVDEALFQRVKYYLSKHSNLTQKSFVIGLIEAELDKFEALEARITHRLDARDGLQDDQATGEGGGDDQTTEEGGGDDQATGEGGGDDQATGEGGGDDQAAGEGQATEEGGGDDQTAGEGGGDDQATEEGGESDQATREGDEEQYARRW